MDVVTSRKIINQLIINLIISQMNQLQCNPIKLKKFDMIDTDNYYMNQNVGSCQRKLQRKIGSMLSEGNQKGFMGC